MTDPLDILSRTLWAEARGCGATGMQRVANVITNRAAHPRWWGHDIASVCLDPWQFSCWNPRTSGAPEDANYRAMMAVGPDDGWLLIARGLAARAIAGTLPDLTGGADSYYALSMSHPPAWAVRAVHTVSDGWHWFGRVELPAPSGGPEAPCTGVSALIARNADELNRAELARIAGSNGAEHQ